MQGAIANYSHFESMQKGLETFFQDADKGKAKFEELRKMSNETTFGVDELANSFTQLANVGVDVDTIRDKLMMLGDVSQGNKQKFAELVSIYSKIQSTGKAGSEQLQMLAMRGLPIYDILKKIGVQGTATGEDVTKALQEMTKEGGQFHNAMNNINETIEGKQGFLSDYLKEMSVNFADVTGLADTYKDVLDVVNEAIGAVSNKLLEWNENPIVKAIIRGSLVAGITAIGVTITTSVVPALISTIAQLKIIAALKAVMNPASLAVGLGVSAVAGLAVAVSTLIDKEKDVNTELKEQIKNRQILGNLPLTSTIDEKSDYLKTMESQLEEYKKLQNTSYEKYVIGVFDGYFGVLAEYEILIKEQEKKIAGFTSRGITKGFTEQIINSNGKIVTVDNRTSEQKDLEKAERQLKKLKESYENLKKSYSDNLYYKSLKQNISGLEKEIDLQKQLEGNLSIINELSPFAKQSKEMKDLQKQLDEVNEMYDAIGIKTKKLDESSGEFKYTYDLEINIDPSYKQKLDEVKEYLEEKLQKVQIDLDFEKADEWRKQIQNILKLDKKDVLSGNGKDIVDIYISNRQKQMSAFLNKNTIASELGLNTSDVSKQIVAFAQDSFKQINALLDTGKFSATDRSIVSLKDNINTLRQQFVDMGGSVEEFNLALGKSPEALEKNFTSLSDISTHLMEIANDSANSTGGRIGAMAGAMAINGAQGSKAGDIANGAIQGASIGGPIGALIGALVALALKTQTFTDSLEDLNGIIDPLITAVNAILKPLTSLAKVIINVLSPILEALATVIENVFNFFFGWLNNYADSTREATKAKEDELAQMKSITHSYQDLLKSIREQEEYYIRKKAELNMYALDDKVTKVNDMILTPNGRFSTHPDDYLIATKNPQGLGSGKVINNIKIINNAGVEVQTSQRQNNGINEMMITISRKIASDVAEGVNGWDNAFAMQQQRVSGRRI